VPRSIEEDLIYDWPPLIFPEAKIERYIPRYIRNNLPPKVLSTGQENCRHVTKQSLHLESRIVIVIMIIARRFSLTNFFIATSALGFQVFVLYPWHKRLDDDFQELKAECLDVLKVGEKARLMELGEIKEQIRALEKRNHSWFWRPRV
jgi:hypothetical protein